MSTTYRFRPGDTFASVAKKVLGSEQAEEVLRASNPGATERDGEIVTLPTERPALPPRPRAPLGEFELLLNGRTVPDWVELRYSSAIDSFSTLSYLRPVNGDALPPLTYPTVGLRFSGTPAFNGTGIPTPPTLAPESRTQTVSAYNAPGVLQDCTPAGSAFPLEFEGVPLNIIADQLARPFGVKTVFAASAGEFFERVSIEPDTRIFQFLTELAQTRGLIITDDVQGALVFNRPAPGGGKVAVLREGEAPLESVTPEIDARNYYSHVTGFGAATVGDEGGDFTVVNPFLRGTVRPYTYRVTNVQGKDVPLAVVAKTGRMISNAIRYRARVATEVNPVTGRLWAPNTLVSLQSETVQVPRPYTFLVRAVDIVVNDRSRSAVLELVIPDGYLNSLPSRVPWGS